MSGSESCAAFVNCSSHLLAASSITFKPCQMDDDDDEDWPRPRRKTKFASLASSLGHLVWHEFRCHVFARRLPTNAHSDTPKQSVQTWYPFSYACERARGKKQTNLTLSSGQIADNNRKGPPQVVNHISIKPNDCLPPRSRVNLASFCADCYHHQHHQHRHPARGAL